MEHPFAFYFILFFFQLLNVVIHFFKVLFVHAWWNGKYKTGCKITRRKELRV